MTNLALPISPYWSRKKTKKLTHRGARGSPKFLFTPNLTFLCDLKPHAKFRNPTITPSGREVTTSEEEREKKKERKNAVNSGHLVPWQHTQATRTNSI